MAKRYNRRQLGNEKEHMAGRFLEQQGYRILEYNFFSRSGEIDIIAKDGAYLVFVEVKYRSSAANGVPEEAVNYRKMLHMTRTAQFYMISHGYPEETPCRFDVVAILGQECHLVKDAFEAV